MTITELIMRLIVLMFLALIAVAGLSGVGLVAWWLGGLVFLGSSPMRLFSKFIKAALLAIGALAFIACLAALAFGAFVEHILRELS